MKKLVFFCLSLMVFSINALGQSVDRWVGLWTWDDEEHATTYELLISPDENNWNTYHLKCQNSCSFNNIKNLVPEISLVIGTSGFYWVEDIQFYREIEGEVIIGDKTE